MDAVSVTETGYAMGARRSDYYESKPLPPKLKNKGGGRAEDTIASNPILKRENDRQSRTCFRNTGFGAPPSRILKAGVPIH